MSRSKRWWTGYALRMSTITWSFRRGFGSRVCRKSKDRLSSLQPSCALRETLGYADDSLKKEKDNAGKASTRS
jgi:hypothetical protein